MLGGGLTEAGRAAAAILSERPRARLEEIEWRTVYLARYARIPPSEQEGRTSRVLWGWVRQTARFLEAEAGKGRLVEGGEDL